MMEDLKFSKTFGFPGQPENLVIDINGGMSAGGKTVRIEMPLGHGVDDSIVTVSEDSGWEDAEIQE